jgi:hypothetical protein
MRISFEQEQYSSSSETCSFLCFVTLLVTGQKIDTLFYQREFQKMDSQNSQIEDLNSGPKNKKLELVMINKSIATYITQ